MAAVSSSISCFNQPLWKVTPARIDCLIKWDSLLKTWLSVFKIRHQAWSAASLSQWPGLTTLPRVWSPWAQETSVWYWRKLRTGAGGHGRSSHCEGFLVHKTSNLGMVHCRNPIIIHDSPIIILYYPINILVFPMSTHYYPIMAVSWNGGTPISSIFRWIFHYKPTILGIPHLWTPPSINLLLGLPYFGSCTSCKAGRRKALPWEVNVLRSCQRKMRSPWIWALDAARTGLYRLQMGLSSDGASPKTLGFNTKMVELAWMVWGASPM